MITFLNKKNYLSLKNVNNSIGVLKVFITSKWPELERATSLQEGPCPEKEFTFETM